jgi:hypothetical protein
MDSLSNRVRITFYPNGADVRPSVDFYRTSLKLSSGK